MNCQHCKNPFDEPKLLPCGATVCNKCVQTSIIDKFNTEKRYKCLICEESHEFPVDRIFKTNLCLLELLKEIKNNATESCQNYKKVIKSNEKIRLELETLIKNGEDFIKEYYLERINEIDLAFEQTIGQVQNFLVQVQNERESVLEDVKKIQIQQLENLNLKESQIASLHLDKLFQEINQFETS